MTENPYRSGREPVTASTSRTIGRLVVTTTLCVLSLFAGFVAGREYEARLNFAHEQETQQRHTKEVSEYLEQISDLRSRL